MPTSHVTEFTGSVTPGARNTGLAINMHDFGSVNEMHSRMTARCDPFGKQATPLPHRRANLVDTAAM